MRSLGCLVILALCVPLAAQERSLPPPTRTPILRFVQERPAAPVTSLAFAADGTTLYVGGLDKVVRNYALKTGDELAPFRLPIGPGNAGAVNAVAVSPDGKWIAVAGRSPMRNEARFDTDDIVISTKQIPAAMRRDSGVIYLFDRTNPNPGKVLRGNLGEVRALAFADPSPADGPVLVSAAIERDTEGGETGALRAWDVVTTKELAAKAGLPATRTLPRLAAWPLGDGVRVAVAWQEADVKKPGVLRIWDTVTNNVTAIPEGELNVALTVKRNLAGNVTAVVSGRFQNEGQLVVRPNNGAAGQVIPLPRENGVQFLPQAVVAAGDLLVALLETTAKPERAGEMSAELRLFSADGATVRRLPLTGLRAGLPVLAASRDGRLVAVAGFVDHRIEVLDVGALGAGKETRQVLGGVSGGFTNVSFLDGNKLWVGEAGQAPDRGGLVFDFAGRKVAANDGIAKRDTPTLDVKLDANTAATPNEIIVTRGDQRIVCALRGREKPTAVAYLPGKDRAVLAVAHFEEGNEVTLVTLFDAATGKRLRQLVGPEQQVRALTFSASRPLLAAVSGDRTVTVWSLADLEKQVGAIDGLLVTDTGTEVTVLSVEKDAAAETRALSVGDVIEGFAAADGKLIPIKTAVAFVWTLRSRPVEGSVALRVKGKAAPLVLPVGRGVEQRGPLFSLWFAPFGKADNPDWVGWNPTGPYDASSPAAEARIGWLTATGDPARPATFDNVEQHRKTYYRKDVLKFLIEKGQLAAGLEAQADAYPPPPPRLLARVLDATPLLRNPKATLRVQIDDVPEDYSLEKAVLRWRIAAPGEKPGEWQTLPLAGQDRTVSIDLAEHRWVRGYHTIDVALRHTATSRDSVSDTIEVPFAFPKPTITAYANGKATSGQPITTETNAVSLSAKVQGSEADVKLTWTDPTGERSSVVLTPKGAGEFAASELKLKPGRTMVKITATTRGAGEFAKDEEDDADVTLDFTPPKIVPVPRFGRWAAPATEPGLVGGKPGLITTTAKVRLTLPIEAANPITTVEWDDGEGQWVAAMLTEGSASRELTLTPGKARTVRVRAKTERSEFATAVADVVFYPTLPAMKYAQLPTTVATPAFIVEGTTPPSEVPYRAAVVVASSNGTRQFDAAVDAKAGTWKAAVLLEPGENRLGLSLSNEWRAEVRRSLTAIALRRPPTVWHVYPVDAGEGGLADVVALVSTADGTAPDGLLVNGRSVETNPRRVSFLPGVVWWELTAPAVPVAGGLKPESVAVAVRSTDGASVPHTAKVMRKPVPLKPPVIALAGGPQDRTTDRPRTTLAFKVSSQTPLVRVEVLHAGRAGTEYQRVASLDPKTATAVAGGFTLDGSADLELRAGVNQVRVVAVNSGGETPTTVSISYTPAGALVVIEGVDELGGTPRPLTRTRDSFAESGGGLVVVRGRVTWPTDDDARAPTRTAVLFANRIGHQPVPLVPVKEGAAEYTFRAPVFLNTTESAVRVELRATGRDGAIPLQSGGDAEFRIRCKNPITQQRLHVVVIGVNVPQTERYTLAKKVVGTLGGAVPPDRAATFDRGEFRVGPFSQAILYPLVVGEVAEGQVFSALDEVSRELKRLSGGTADRWLNDVVLVYYQGKDWVGADGRRWLHTSRSLRLPENVADRYAVRVEGLPDTPGVRLHLLNVTNAGPAVDALAAGPPLLRYGWKDAAALERLFPLLEKAVASRRSLGDIVTDVRGQVTTDPNRAGDPVEVIPLELRDRPLGTGSK